MCDEKYPQHITTESNSTESNIGSVSPSHWQPLCAVRLLLCLLLQQELSHEVLTG